MDNYIIQDLEILDEKFLPERLVHREKEVEDLKNHLMTLLKTNSKINLIIHGKPGTGKTSTSKIVMDKFSEFTSSVKLIYVNCWETYTAFNTLYSIVEKIRPLSIHRKGMAMDELFSKLQPYVGERKLVIILDEADKLENDALIYSFLEKGIPIILLSNSEDFYLKYDPRTLSRLHPFTKTEFRKYTTNQLADILMERIKFALLPNKISREIIEEIADKSAGDARMAISILKNSAVDAENKNQEKIDFGNLNFEVVEKLPELNIHQKLLYEIIKKNNEINSQELYEKFYSTSKEKISERTIRNYLEKLENYQLIKSEGQGRWRKYLHLG